MKYSTSPLLLAIWTMIFFLSSCGSGNQEKTETPAEENLSVLKDPNLTYQEYTPKPTDLVISRSQYREQLQGFWLAQCIANWTGLITENDKIGVDRNTGEPMPFYTRENWGGPDDPAYWSDEPSGISPTIDFVFIDEDSVWGADDDTDIEYIYQHITYQNQAVKLTGEQIRDGWLTHIYTEENSPFTWGDGTTKENFLWVSNQSAHDLMVEGMVPPETSHPDNNPNYEMIDAQLTTEIFGFFAPARPDVALEIAELPIQTTARYNAQWAAEFYVIMYSLASYYDSSLPMKERLTKMADEARKRLPNDSYSATMYDYVKGQYQAGVPWEDVRDGLYQKYQVNQEDGYDWATRDEICYGCVTAGINFGASIVSLYYGEGDIKETIKIGALAGWDSDNPTATWGGLLGFMLGKEGVEEAFGRKFSDRFNIHRTRGGFPNDIDTFDNMASTGVFVVDRVVQERIGGGVDLEKDQWYIPVGEIEISAGQ